MLEEKLKFKEISIHLEPIKTFSIANFVTIIEDQDECKDPHSPSYRRILLQSSQRK
jgi:hypothetical protein